MLFLFSSLGKESNFEKAQSETVDNQGIGYDYGSVMHYSSDAFSRNGQPTIEPKVSNKWTMAVAKGRLLWSLLVAFLREMTKLYNTCQYKRLGY